MSIGDARLSFILQFLAGIYPQHIDGEEKLLRTPIPGDFTIRAGTPTRNIISGLEQILREEVQLPIKMELREIERKVIVVRGKFRLT